MAYNPCSCQYEPNFGVGARVRVIRQRKYPAENLKGLIGTVRTDSGNNVSVIFDTIKNPRSSYGCFYFKASELEAVDEFIYENVKENNMSVCKITNYLNVARVEFPNTTGTYMVANFDEGLKKGDLCVVTRDRYFSVAKVVEILVQNDIDVEREVVTKLYTEDYDRRVECRAKAAELKSKMEARAKQLQDIALYQMLAKDDPDMAALLQEYQGLPKL